MEDILYTLLAIGWIAYGIYRGIQKNKKSSPKKQVVEPYIQEEEKQEKSSALKAVFGELFDLPQDEHDKMKQAYQEEILGKNPKSTPVSEIHLETEALDSYSGTDSISSVFNDQKPSDTGRIIANKDVDSQYEEDGIDDNEEGFDLRQAIIHQVILDRPY